MKSLDTIQKIFNACKIISSIGKIVCIVGSCLGFAGIISLVFLPDAIKLGGVTIKGLIEKSDDVSIGTGIASVSVLMVTCIGYAILLKIAEKYFTNELAAGTPFTFEGAKELNLLGLYTICIPLISEFASQIVCQILKRTMTDVVDIPIESATTVTLGLVLMLLSLICKYGAEVISNKNEAGE